jgi:RNA polymerase sigma-70 factor (ECF subfamily)
MIRKVSTSEPEPADQRIRQFIDSEYAHLVAVVGLVCGDPGAAEELVQEALSRAWELDSTGEPIGSYGAWVRTAALNLARTRRRRYRLGRLVLARLGSGAQDQKVSDMGLSDRRLDLLNAVRKLPVRQRQVVALHYFLDMEGTEVSRSLGISRASVKSLLFRARRNLEASLLGPGDQGPGHGKS